MVAKRVVRSSVALISGVSWVTGLLLWMGSGLSTPTFAADLGSGQLLIAGTRLTVTPESQTVPFDTPTIVETRLKGYDAANGTLPPDMRVKADFTGPEIDGVMTLEAVPNQPLRVPRLRLEGDYQLDNIRLVQGEELLAYAEPRSAAVKVTQVLITKVTSRPLTIDEIRSYGIVITDDSFQAFNFTFGFAVDGKVIDYNVPIFYGFAKETPPFAGWDLSPWGASARFQPPRMAPFQLEFESGGGDTSSGGCEDPEGDCTKGDYVPIPGVILFPTDVSLLHQFFSVVLIAQNGAPAGDALVLRDLTAKVKLPPGLRQAKTDPPTSLGVPVPIRVPGPDGRLGTGDDLTFLVAQASGEAEVLIEGMREGTHVVQFDLEGILEGLPGGRIERVVGTAKGAVIVRDPTLNITITHPDVVRTDEEYSLLLTVTNTGPSPANLLSIELPLHKLSGVEVVGPNEKTASVMPGDSELYEFRLLSKRTGKVVASAVRSDGHINPSFELTVGVGENDIPLSPNSIILPRSTEILPAELTRRALNLIGLGFSLATMPATIGSADLPDVTRTTVDERIYQLSQFGRHVKLGEDIFDSAAVFAAEWTGSRDAEWEWDRLRRTTQKGAWVGSELAKIFAAEADATSHAEVFERFAATTGFLGSMQAAMAVGEGATIEVSSRVSGQRVAGPGTSATRLRALPFADLYDLAGSQMAIMAVPEADGYQARVRRAAAGLVDVLVLVPDGDGDLRVVRWEDVSLGASGLAVVDFKAADTGFTLHVDEDGDGTVDDELPGDVDALARRPFAAVAAALNAPVDPSAHVVDVLFSADVDIRSLLPSDPQRFSIPGKLSNGGLIEAEQDVATLLQGTLVENPFEGLRNTRVVRVVFDNPLSPYVEQNLTVRDLASTIGDELVTTTLPVVIEGVADGVLVEGQVMGPDGEAVPFAEVELWETDYCDLCMEDNCRAHKTGAMRTDASGRYKFDFVRQTRCSDVFAIRALDPVSTQRGSVNGRVRLIGQTLDLDIVMLGRGTLRGRVTYDDGSVPASIRVIAENPVFREGRLAKVDANGNYTVGDVPVGAITLSATDRDGKFVVTTIELPAAGAVVEKNLVILRVPEQPVGTGEVRGTVTRPDGTTPVSNAHVALYVDGNLVGVQRTGSAGGFDFGQVPAGHGEIETFDGETGLSGVQVFFEVERDRVNEVALRMREERGTVEGRVFRKTIAGDVPVFGAIVWAEGTPFKTVTDASGFYRIEGVYSGTRQISAADLDKKVKVSEVATIATEGQTVTRNLYFVEHVASGIAGEVLNFDGTPVFGATVHLAAGPFNWFKTAKTDSAGRFTIPDLGPGGYGVHAFRGAVGGTAVATVRFPGDTPFVTIRFKKGTIRGVVKAENESGALVGVISTIVYRTTTVRFELLGLDDESHTIETAADGTFEIPDVLVGPYSISVHNAFYGSRTVHDQLVHHGEVHDHPFTFALDSTGTISGTVLNHDAVTPVEGATVHLRHPSFSAFDLTTDADGRFQFELVPAHHWTFPVEVVYQDGIVFRQARVYVQYHKKGQNLDVQIVLPKQGSVSGLVADANGVPVPGAVVTLNEHQYPHRQLVANADQTGAFRFNNIFTGTAALSARAPSLGGLGGKTTVEVKAEGEEVAGITIFLEPTGKIVGQVLSPETGLAVPNAEVKLWRHWLFDSANTDDEGRFEFDLLPMGAYAVSAFDPRTGRRGARGELHLGSNNQVLEADFELEARGSVDGHLYDDGDVGVPAATVTLGTGGLTRFVTYSSTDAQGLFEFGGIPEGPFDLSTREPGGRRRASGKGQIETEDQLVTVDLRLEHHGAATGTVLNPIGAPNGSFPNANVVIWQDGLIIGATLESAYRFPGVIAGRDFEIRADEIGGKHRGTARGRLADGAAEVALDVRMRPLGAVRLTVRDSFGNPIPGAAVSVYNDGFYGNKHFQGSTAGDASISFGDVGEGRISAYAVNPSNGLRGSTSGVLTLDGQIVELAITLQNSGQVRGTVLLADGVTPAANAVVALATNGRTLTSVTDETGAFAFVSVPLGGFTLTVQESFGPGTRVIGGTLATNGQVIDLGTIVLDDKDPSVVEITPVAGAVDVALTTPILITFSEPIDVARHHASWLVSLTTAAGHGVGGVGFQWLDDNKTLKLTINQGLANFTQYRLRVTTNVHDPAGRRMREEVQTSFTTVDVLPPVVIEAQPANGAKQLPLDTQVKLRFNEPVDYFSFSGTAVRLTEVGGGQGAGVTTTITLDTAGRTLTITPAQGLEDERMYQLTVVGFTDRVGNVQTTPFTTTFSSVDTIPPRITAVVPADGAVFTAGARIDATATIQDPSGVAGSTFALAGQSRADATTPYGATLYAPPATAAGDVTLTVQATDVWGNLATATRTIQVTPRADDADGPSLAIPCPADGDLVAPGLPVAVSFAAADDKGLFSIALSVDGQPVETTYAYAVTELAGAFTWTPPAGAAPGTTFLVRIEARDFADRVTAVERTLAVPTGTLLTGNQTLDASRNGQSLALAAGTFTATAPLDLASLTLLGGARLVATNGTALDLGVAGALRVHCGATIDVTALGFAGGTGSHPNGHAPAGVAGAKRDAGGSHGGTGVTDTHAGPAGPVYDSVYVPHLAGGGGSYTSGDAGGGVLTIEAGTLTLEGRILARGADACGDGAGAGGSVVISADVVRGTGSIDASGGGLAATCNSNTGAGGGGRVSIYADSFDGFDPAAQVRAYGGWTWNAGKFAAPGTIFSQLPAQSHGVLLIDAGEHNGADRRGPATRLPRLGQGTVAAFEAAGADAWVSTSGGFRREWLGAGMALTNAAGTELGTFRVAALDGAGRARLTGAAAQTAAATFRGEYRFDRVDLVNGAGLEAEDRVASTDLTFAGEAEVSGEVHAANALVASGAIVRPAVGAALTLSVSGTITVEAGATVSVSGKGFAANTSAPGVAASQRDAGGSHGGTGVTDSHAGPAGPIFDSVYVPHLSGGGGSYTNGGAGGGVLTIDAGTLVLEGELLAKGIDGCANGAGAGGSVLVRADVVQGAGSIDASGGGLATGCNSNTGAGGGGRVAIYADDFDGFDPAAQVRAYGGWTWSVAKFAAPGTILSKLAAQEHGTLLIDAGQHNNVDRSGPATELPELGEGTVSAFAAAGADAWVSVAGGFGSEWLGAWMTLVDGTGAELGTFQVLALDGTGRARLAGAAAETGAATFRGEYRFDRVELVHGAGLQSADPVVGPDMVLQGNAEVTGEVRAANVTVKSGAVVRPASGQELTFVVSGTMTVEAGAAVSVSGKGYAGGSGSHHDGHAPDGIAGAKRDAGGSHGGIGVTDSHAGPAGPIFDSVYVPHLSGGGGSYTSGAAGGGVLTIDAGTLVLEGALLAKGLDACANGAGAGGSVLVRADVVRGAGSIDASGGGIRPIDCNSNTGAGGGGRVALYADSFDGFDPAAQVSAYGGWTWSVAKFAAPGTIFSKLAAQSHGVLLIDAGQHNGVDRSGPATELPELGQGSLEDVEAAGADAWVSVAGGFGSEWLGAWMTLADGTGAELGTFQVLALDAAGRARLAGAAAHTGAAVYSGEYRFDRIDLVHGAGVEAADPVVGPDMVLQGNAEVTGEVRATNVTVKTGAVVRPASGRELTFVVSGTMTVEAGATVSVSGKGFAANTSAPGVAASQRDAGGSHGGIGVTDSHAGPAGPVFDSVYVPHLSGGGGSYTNGGAGGGVLTIDAGTLVLEGALLAKGIDGCANGAGAGGSVLVRADVVQGAGSIDASGGGLATGCNSNTGAGGGGRVAIYANDFDGFDPAAQVRAYGGWTWSVAKFAAPGTILSKLASQEHGTLLIDAGQHNNVDRSGPATELPELGEGTVSAFAAAGADAWVSVAVGFGSEWLGAWMTLVDGTGAELGTFQVLALDGTGRALLAGAAADGRRDLPRRVPLRPRRAGARRGPPVGRPGGRPRYGAAGQRRGHRRGAGGQRHGQERRGGAAGFGSGAQVCGLGHDDGRGGGGGERLRQGVCRRLGLAPRRPCAGWHRRREARRRRQPWRRRGD